jgi:Ca2+-binding RTX toxin-like protein
MAVNRRADGNAVTSPVPPLYQPGASIPQPGQPSLENVPLDPLFNQQWYLLNRGQTGGTPGVDLNVLPVWKDYMGTGVKVAVLDDGVQYVHPDLSRNYDTQIDVDTAELDADPAPGSFDQHGTAVAGIIAAAKDNGIGGVGVAPGATLAGIRFDFYEFFGSPSQDGDALQHMADFDVVNNSWEYVEPFFNNFSDSTFQAQRVALQNAAQAGRNGLGTVVVFAAGNGREYGDNSNYRNLQNSRFVTAVAALTHKGVQTSYSSPGANILISAFGGELDDGIVTTDRLGLPGYNNSPNSQVASDYTNNFGGTSAAAPMVSGVVALMLEANPNLGYRDVQEILAYSARQNDATNPGWAWNRAKNWNGGGLHTSYDYGFGMVDAHAAVRLAETWTMQSTAAKEQVLTANHDLHAAIPDGVGQLTDPISLPSGLIIDHVEADLEITHSLIGDLEVVLTSPDGTESLLLARPGVTEANPVGSTHPNLKFTFCSTRDWGEVSAGDWKLTVRDRITGQSGTLNSWALRLYGDPLTDDNTYIYTDEYANFATEPARTTLTDTAGIDTVNAAALTSNTTLNLNPGTSSSLANRSISISSGSIIETAFTGDGDDTIIGNQADNVLNSGRGQDRVSGEDGRDALNGGKGKDTLDGGADSDTLTGGAEADQLIGGQGSDRFLYSTSAPFTATDLGIDTLTDFASGTDKIGLSKSTFAALTSGKGHGFSVKGEFANVADDTAAASSRALIVYSSTGSLFYNPNGSGAGYGTGAKFAILKGNPTLAATDFVLQ